MLVNADALQELRSVDSIVFDIDGVLIDVSESFRVVTCEAVRLYAELILQWEVDTPLLKPNETELIKSAGGFNSDWDVVKAVMLFYLFKRFKHGSKKASELRRLKPSLEEFFKTVARMGGGFENAERYILSQCDAGMRQKLVREWNPRLLVRLFQELYGGDEWCHYLYGFRPQYVKGRGYIEREKVLVDVNLIPKELKLAILTGRTKREAELALKKCNIIDLIPPQFWMTDDDGLRKPDGRALWLLLDRIGSRNAIYVGDGVDDLMTVQNYRQWAKDDHPKVLFCAVLSDTRSGSERQKFIECGADIISPDVNFLLRYIRSLRELGADGGSN
jgi:HAD superfamily hydrolase (TIGR01548 family)